MVLIYRGFLIQTLFHQRKITKMNLYFTLLINILIAVHAATKNLTLERVIFDTNITKVFSYEVPLNHFNIYDTRQLKFRYIELYPEKNGSRVKNVTHLVVQLDFRKEVFNMTTSPVFQWYPSYIFAKEVCGVLLLLELRFYGESKPEGFNNSFYGFEFAQAKNTIKYFNSEQILEDVISFIKFYQRKLDITNNKKVAVFGCSYAGNVATWLRYKYPHIVDAAWASSAPLDVTLERDEIEDEVIGEMYKHASPICYEKIRNVFKKIQNIINKPNKTISFFEIGKLFNRSCTNKDGRELLYHFRWFITNPFHSMEEIKALCNYLTETNNSTIREDLLRLFTRIINESSVLCMNYNTHLEKDMNTYVLRYQMCTEFGHSTSTTTSTAQEHRDASYSSTARSWDNKACDNKLYYMMINETGRLQDVLLRNINRKIRLYGTKDTPVTQVFFIYGKFDPWLRLGRPLNASTFESPVIYVPECLHCCDMPTSHPFLSNTELNNNIRDGITTMKEWLIKEHIDIPNEPTINSFNPDRNKTS